MSTVPVKLPNDATNTGPQMHAESVLVDGQTLLQQVVKVAGLTPLQDGSLPVDLQSPVVTGVVASNGVVVPVDSLTEANTFVDGQLQTSTVVYLGVTYTMTITYAGGFPVGISRWVAQP